MTLPERTGSDGVRAARALLSLIEEHAADDFEAAESILGGQKDLVKILQLLREFKRQQSPEELEPVSIEGLSETVRRELLGMPLNSGEIRRLAQEASGHTVRAPPNLAPEDTITRSLRSLEEHSQSPLQLASMLLVLLGRAADLAGPGHRERVQSLLGRLAIQALTENAIVLPTLHSIAQLRTLWGRGPLPYKPQEPRQRVAERLLKDAERSAPHDIEELTHALILEGLRGPADRAVAETRRMNTKKAHGE